MIHLINIAPEFRGVEDFSRPPSGILYVGGHLRRAGFEVRVHHITSREVEETIRAIAADPNLEWVGISFFTGPPVARAWRISEALKRACPGVRIVWGGIHPSSLPEDCLRDGAVDVCVKGEGEETALELAKAWRDGTDVSGIAGLAWRRADGEIVLNAWRAPDRDLDRFSQDWSLVNPERYVRRNRWGERTFCFVTSRGCPYECGYCYVIDFHRRRWRAHSPEFVLDQMLWLKKRCGLELVTFDDDEFFVDRKRGFKVLEDLKREGITCDWLETVLDYVTEEFLERLSDLGVRTVFAGWESGSDETSKLIKTGFTRDFILEKFRLIARHPRLTVDASAIVGFPGETEEDIERTISTMLDIHAIHPNVNFNLGVYVPFPGTPLFNRALEYGYRLPENPEAWEDHDILKGTMSLPWLPARSRQRLMLADRYAKMLHVGPRTVGWRRMLRRLGAAMAAGRLRTRFFALPVEAAVNEWWQRRSIRKNLDSSMMSLGGVGSPISHV